jgi:hypothetical protein
MADYTDDIRDLIASLTNPRYANQEPPATAPILFDGRLQGRAVNFVAHHSDPLDYGVEVWEQAKAGAYGPIGPYTPWVPPPDPPQPIPPADRDLPINRLPEILERLDALEAKVGNGRRKKEASS